MSLALAILPLILTIVCGYGIARIGLIPRSQWDAIETLSFRVLIPALLVLAIAEADVSVSRFGGLVAAMVLALACLSALVFALKWAAGGRLANPQFTSLFQTTIRWNAFVALAAVDQLLDGAFDILGVAIAISIPLINVTCIVVLASFGPSRTSLRQVLHVLVRNPLILACVCGLTLNLTGIGLAPPVAQTLDLLGRAALGVGLLALGAGISLRRLGRWRSQVVGGMILRPIISPAVFWCTALLFGLNEMQTFVGVIIFAAPAATNGFIVARQMGGDPELYVDVLTWQTLLSLAMIPVWAYLLL